MGLSWIPACVNVLYGCIELCVLLLIFLSLSLSPAELGDYDPVGNQPGYVSEFRFIPGQVSTVRACII